MTGFYMKCNTGLKWAKRYIRIGKLQVQTTLGTWMGLETQPSYDAANDLLWMWVKKQTQWLLSNEAGCPLDSGQNLNIGQLNST